jgi:predicted regulator of Ras-like GTPase activity (Roadblock/LC7/MglB family)
MPTLRDLIETLLARPDVAGAVVLGRDGLLVDAGGLAPADAEHVAAVAPGIAQAADAMGAAAGDGALTTAVLEFARGLAVVSALSAEALLVVRLAPDAAPGPLVRELRRHRSELAALV